MADFTQMCYYDSKSSLNVQPIIHFVYQILRINSSLRILDIKTVNSQYNSTLKCLFLFHTLTFYVEFIIYSSGKKRIL